MNSMAIETNSFKAMEKYYGELHRFGVRLAETATLFQQLARNGKFPERGLSFSYDRSNPNDILNRSIDITREFEFLVAVTGAFSSGKSTLLNVLLNYADLLPSSAIPMTAVCTVVRLGKEPRLRVRYVPLEECFDRVYQYIDRPFKKEFRRLDRVQEALERPENFLDAPEDQESLRRFARMMSGYDRLVSRSPSFGERHRYIAGGGVVLLQTETGTRYKYFIPTPAQEREYLASKGDPELWVDREHLSLIQDVTLWVDSPLLQNNIVFLDLPGLNCREDYHRRAIQKYCNMADCIVVTAFQAGNQADEEVIQKFKKLSSNFSEKLFFVFNRVDQFQTEPEELTRSFDYLTRDTIGQNFSSDRAFLTSAFLARENLLKDQAFPDNFEAFARSFRSFRSDLGNLEDMVRHATSPEDPGGVKHFRDCLQTFLREQAYPAKMSEILNNYERVLGSLHGAAAPRYDEVLHMDQQELLLRAALEYFQRVIELGRKGLYAFRFDYLRAHENGSSSLAQDLKGVLSRAHEEVQKKISAYFNQPIHSAPPRNDPVQEFDLRRIADDASNQLRREFQDLLATAVGECVRGRFHDYLDRQKFHEHLKNLFRGAPECLERLDRILERFESMLRHSILCKIRVPFYRMPGGRDLKRLERPVRLAETKAFLIKVFSDFYPDWIYQNIYGEIQDGLWLSFFLDGEELEGELAKFFDGCQGALTHSEVLEGIKVPEEFSDGLGDLYEAVGVCRQIEELLRDKDDLKSKNVWHSNGRA